MSALFARSRILASRIRGLFARRKMDRDFAQELGSHLEMLTDENIRRGMTPDEARRAARLRLGGVTQLRETNRELQGSGWLDALGQDFRYGLRTFWRARWVSLAAVATLALGIGANTALFSVVDTVLLRSLPYADPGRLVILGQQERQGNVMTYFSPTTFFDWRSQNHSFSSMSAVDTVDGVQVTFGGRAEPVQVSGQTVSASFLDVLGVRPVLGRNFRAEEDFPNRDKVALVSYAVWQSGFGGSPGVAGAHLTIDGFPFTVIGVLPANFEFLGRPSFLVPLARDPDARWMEGRDLQIVARLRPGASVAQAQADLTILTRKLERDGPPILTGGDSEARLTPVMDSYVGDVRPALLVLLGAVLCVLLIACANVANLLLARATTRQREMAVRASLGASRGRLIRQLLTESVVLAGIGGLLGLLVAWWGAQFLLALVPASMPIPRLEAMRPEPAVLLFSFGVTLATAFLVGLVPAFRASRQEAALAMRQGARGAVGAGSRLRAGLVAVEVALAMVLLVAAGLLLRTFAHLRAVDPGFSQREVLACNLKLPDAQYRTGEQVSAFFAQLVERVRGIPGVRSAAAIDELPVSGAGGGTWVHVEGKPEPPPGQQSNVMVRAITPGYFATLGVPLLAGRDFTDADNGVLDLSKLQDHSRPLKLIVNQALVDRFLPGENPLGQRLAIFWGQTLVGEIVAVVGNVRYQGLAEQAEPTFYWPEAQRPHSTMHLVVRTAGRPMDWLTAVRGAIRSVDPNVPLTDAETLTDVLSVASSRTRFSLVLLGAFGGIALLLAAMGLFGVMAYSVAQRTQEIGIRMALGAKRAGIIGMVLKSGMTLVLIGLVCGAVAAVALTRFLSTELYGVRATDSLTFAAVALTLGSTALGAVLIPALRASNVEPTAALRYE